MLAQAQRSRCTPYQKEKKSLRLNEKRQCLMDKILENSRAIEPGKVEMEFVVAGRGVCKSAWCTVHGISSR